MSQLELENIFKKRELQFLTRKYLTARYPYSKRSIDRSLMRLVRDLKVLKVKPVNSDDGWLYIYVPKHMRSKLPELYKNGDGSGELQ